MKPMKIRLSLFILAGLLLLNARAADGPLDGTAWTVQAVPTVETSGTDIFPRQTFLERVEALRDRPCGLHRHRHEGLLQLGNRPVLQAKGKAQWDGVIKEQDITGNLKWVTKTGEVRYYFINGKKR